MPPKKKSAVKRSTPVKKAKVKKTAKKTLPGKTAARKIAAPKPKSPEKTVLPPLPDEHCENKIVIMPVTPSRIYVYWNVAADKMADYKGSLNLKVLDTKDNCFFYTPVSGWAGESFINIKPESDCLVELGMIDNNGEFMNILQPESEFRTAMPAEKCHEEIVLCRQNEVTDPVQERALPDEFFEMPESVSSY